MKKHTTLSALSTLPMRWTLGGAATLLLIASLGCVSTTTGKEGNLQFSYFTDDNVRDFNKPIAVGARLELKVQESGTGDARDVVIQKAVTEGDALAVADFSGDRVVIEAKAEGSSEIQVEAKVSRTGDVVTDAVDMMARVPTKHILRHTCAESTATGLYMVGQEIWIPFEFKLDNGTDVIGYGYYPVTHEPASALTMKTGTKDQQYIRYTASATPGDVTIASTIQTSSTLKLTLLTEADIDGSKLIVDVPIESGKTGAAYVLPTRGGTTICQAVADLTVTTVSTETCEVNRIGDDSELADLINAAANPDRRSGALSVRGIKEGECSFDVTYPKANGGQGITETHKLMIKAVGS